MLALAATMMTIASAESIAHTAEVVGPSFIERGVVTFGGSYSHLTADIDFDSVISNHDSMLEQLKKQMDIVEATANYTALSHFILRPLKIEVRARMKSIALRVENTAEMFGIHTRSNGDYNAPFQQDPNQRPKRQLIEAAFSVFGAGLGLYNMYELQQLKQQLAEDTDIIHHRLDKQEMQISTNTLAIQRITSALGEINSVWKEYQIVQDIKQQVEDILYKYEAAVNDFVQGLSAMGQEKGRLSPYIIPPKPLYSALAKINETAKERGARMLQLNGYSYPYSLLINNSKIEIIVHVSIVERYFHLFRFHSLPFYQNNTYLRVDTDIKYIAVAQQDDKRGAVLSQAELDACVEHTMPDYKLWACPGRILARDIYAGCVGCLFSGKPHNGKCRYEYAAEVDEAFLLSGGRIVVYAGSKEINTWEYCANSTKSTKVNPLSSKIISATKGCRTVLVHSEYTAFDDEYIKLHYDLPLARHVRLEVPAEHQDLVDELLRDVPKVSSDLVTFLHGQREEKKRHSYSISAGLIILAILIIVAYVVYVVGFYRFRQKKRRQHHLQQEQPPEPLLPVV
jgi:hypothetical protein